ncbi:MAG TPA: hypothetical protein VGO68_15340 [Pyrinomonadaceae bacterium]|jgi:hypothetical protein|nr:hypothetical protein [Pyrinomonadaceae bacterium]
MSAKLINWTSEEPRHARLELESGQTVRVGGSYLDNTAFSCAAIVKNIFGLPTKRIWKFAFITTPEWSDKNLVYLDFDKYLPFHAVVGYAMQFKSIDEMRGAQDKHASLFDAEKAIDTLIEIGVIQRND